MLIFHDQPIMPATIADLLTGLSLATDGHRQSQFDSHGVGREEAANNEHTLTFAGRSYDLTGLVHELASVGRNWCLLPRSG
jgi:hypothetical protein